MKYLNLKTQMRTDDQSEFTIPIESKEVKAFFEVIKGDNSKELVIDLENMTTYHNIYALDEEGNRYSHYLSTKDKNGVYQPDLVEIEKVANESRLSKIRSKANEVITVKYPIEKQSSANLGIYGQPYLDSMTAFIATVIGESNRLEADSTLTVDDWDETIN